MYACRVLFRREFFKFFVLSRSRPCLLISQWKSDNKKIAVCCYPGSEPSFLPSKVRTWKPKIKEVAFGEILIHPLYSEMFKSYDFPQDWNKLPGQGNELNIEMVSGEWNLLQRTYESICFFDSIHLVKKNWKISVPLRLLTTRCFL